MPATVITLLSRFRLGTARLSARAGNGLALAQAAWHRGGGVLGAVTSAVRLYRRDGVEGLRRGLRLGVTYRQDPQGFILNNYAQWLRRYDRVTPRLRDILRQRAVALPGQPLISVLMPVYNGRRAWLLAAIDSVRRQIYPHWELCIADDASTDPAILSLLQRQARKDPRIKVVLRDTNGHISAASNSALELATGAWIALLDHDDLLSEHALFWVADAINGHPDARLIYSDEDKLDAFGRRFSPYFKCDWNLDLFYSQNLFSHLGVYKAALVRQVGGFRLGLEGSQDYDLALRCLENIDPGQVHHIPRVLYHWRVHAQSTAQAGAAKPYAQIAGERALSEHFARLGIRAKAERIAAGYRVKYALPEPPPLASLIVLTRNHPQLLRRCIDSIRSKTTYPNLEILVIDNGSDDPAQLAYLRSIDGQGAVRVISDARPYNFSALNNAAVRVARGELLCLMNDDVEVIAPDWLVEMASHALRPGVGAVGARLLYPDGTVQHVGTVLGLGGCAGHVHHHMPGDEVGYFGRAVLTHAVSAVTAACLVVRKSIYQEVGGLNEIELPVAYNDVDFCLRVRAAGYGNVLTPHAELVHLESATRGPDDTPAKKERLQAETAYMERRWGRELRADPAYSPNLSLERQDCSLAWPPRIELPGVVRDD